MKQIPEIFKKIRFAGFFAIIAFSLMTWIGAYGCTSGSSGPGSGGSTDDKPGCTDRDGDGYYVEEGCGKRLDCNDGDLTIHPGADEYCVGIDNDCDGLIDEDCLPEDCGDGRDDDGDGVIDEACGQGTSFISDTGQTRCYDTMDFIYPCPSPGEAFFGQDASYSTAASPFTKLDAGGAPLTKDATYWTMVRDNLTGLTWEVKTDDDSIHDKGLISDLDDAAGVFITQLNDESFGGFSDWRIPTIYELSSLVNMIGRKPAIDTDYFPNTMEYYYWSPFLTVHPETGHDVAWVLNFYNGAVTWERKDWSAYIRAVRGPQLSPIFTDNGDGTVTATFNGGSLMWAQNSTSERITWQEALDYCENLELAGYSDWRLPNIKELRMLVDYGGNSPAIDINLFPDTVGGYWSSTTNVDDVSEAWVVDFINGSSFGGNDKTYDYHKCRARAVRGGQ